MANKRKRIEALSQKDIALILSALWDAKCWQESIADAHHHGLAEWHRSRENTAVAKRAEKQGARYAKLHDELKGENNE